MRAGTFLVAAALAASAGYLTVAAAQNTIMNINPSIPALGRVPKYFGLGVSAGRQWYQCPDCSVDGNDAVTVMGRAGWQVANRRGLVGVEGSLYLNGQERVVFLLASGNVLALNQKLLLGGGFGFTGFRLPTIHLLEAGVCPFSCYPYLQEGPWRTFWGLGADLHVEWLVPLRSGWVIAPRIAYSRTVNSPMSYFVEAGGGGYEGAGDIAVLQVGTSVMWRGKRHSDPASTPDRSPQPSHRLPQPD